MTKKYDITSTEKLLERIRQDQSGQKYSLSLEKQDRSAEVPAEPGNTQRSRTASGRKTTPARPIKQKSPSSPKRSFSLSRRKNTNVGIDFNLNGIGLSLIQFSGGTVEQASVRHIPYETGPFKSEETLLTDLLDDTGFSSFLQAQLHKFCDNLKKPSLWCALPRESVKVYNVTIPKVPDNEIANTIYWNLQKEHPFNPDDSIIDFDLVKEIQEDSITKLLAIVYLARQPEVDRLKELFHKTGYTPTGISTPTVALQNEIRRGLFNCEDESFSRLVVGENKSFIEIYYRNTLVFSRDIKTGIASFIDSLMEMAASRGIILTEDQCRTLIMAEDREVAALAGGYGLFNDGERDIFSLELPAPVRLIRQMERTFGFYQNNFQVPRCTAIFISGISFSDTRLADYLSTEIGIPCHVHTPFDTLSRPITILGSDNADGGYKLVPPFDMALSEPDETRNFLIPRALREKKRQETKVSKIAIFSTALLLTACSAIFFWQYGQIQEKQIALQASNGQLSKGMFTDEAQANTLLMSELSKFQEYSSSITNLATRYLPSALLGQITLSLPPEIKLRRYSLDEKIKNGSDKNNEKGMRRVNLEGIVTGNPHNMEFILARYINTIVQSSFIVSAIVIEKSTDTYMNEDVLTFTVSMRATLAEKTMDDDKKV
jgi:Tfp pilus assembly PilM family ATPase